jgi:hypothetical protein
MKINPVIRTAAQALIVTKHVTLTKKAHAEASSNKKESTIQTQQGILPSQIKNISPATPLEKVQSVAADIPNPLQKPASALIPALGATSFLYPINFALTLKQKNNTPIPDSIRQMTDNFTNPRKAYTGLAPILKMAVLQRTMQYTALEQTKEFLKKHTDFSTTQISLIASAVATLPDTLLMAPAELESMIKQLAVTAQKDIADVLKDVSKSRAYKAIAIRDLVANSVGFTLPQALREEWNMEHDLPNRLGTTFASQALANTVLTPLDSIKTAVFTQPKTSLKDCVVSLWDSNRLWNGYGLRTIRQASMFTMVFVGAEQIYKTLFPKPNAA